MGSNWKPRLKVIGQSYWKTPATNHFPFLSNIPKLYIRIKAKLPYPLLLMNWKSARGACKPHLVSRFHPQGPILARFYSYMLEQKRLLNLIPLPKRWLLVSLYMPEAKRSTFFTCRRAIIYRAGILS